MSNRDQPLCSSSASAIPTAAMMALDRPSPGSSAFGFLPRPGSWNAAAIPSLITALEQDGLRVASATIARPSLDDVYLRHAGRSFRDADADTKEEAA